MRKILLVITPISDSKLITAIESLEHILKGLGVVGYNINVMRSETDVWIPDFITSNYKEVDLLFRETISMYDDIYIIEGMDKLKSNDLNGNTFGKYSRVLEKYNLISVDNDTTELSSLKDIVIDDFIGDSFIVGKTRKEINKFINIYLDNLKIMADTPEYSKEVNDVKRGLNILYNRLEGIKEEDNG